MWSFYFVVPSILFLCVFLAFYFSRPRLSLTMNRDYLGLLGIEALVIFLDVVSSLADSSHENYSTATLVFLNLAFFVFFLGRIYVFFLCTVDLLHLSMPKRLRILRMAVVPFAICEAVALATPWTGAIFTIDGAGYHSGPQYNLIYVCFFAYIILSLVVIMTNRQKLSQYEFASLLAVHGLLAIGNILRLVMPHVLIMDMFCHLAIIVIYLAFENPDLYLSTHGSAFNRRGFHEVLRESSGRREYRILGIALRNYSDQRGIYGSNHMDGAIRLISRYLIRQFRGRQVFYLNNGCFAIYGPVDMDWQGMQEQISLRFRESWDNEDVGMYLNPGFILAGSECGIHDAERFYVDLQIAYDEAGSVAMGIESTVGLERFVEIDHLLEVRRCLEKAVERDAVEVFLQPVMDSHTMMPAGAEALARIRDDDGNLVPPAVFIPLAEKNGLIHWLGAQVFEKVCCFIEGGEPGRLGIEWINVNVSPIQCMRYDLPDELVEIARRHGVQPEKIHLEITEESRIDSDILQKQIIELRERGFRLSLDDYGSGYSNLSRVKRQFFINIKLDMSLVREYAREKNSLLPAIVQAFREEGYSITAEGVETSELAQSLVAAGCDYLQGYCFSRPLPFDTFIEKCKQLREWGRNHP